MQILAIQEERGLSGGKRWCASLLLAVVVFPFDVFASAHEAGPIYKCSEYMRVREVGIPFQTYDAPLSVSYPPMLLRQDAEPTAYVVDALRAWAAGERVFVGVASEPVQRVEEIAAVLNAGVGTVSGGLHVVLVSDEVSLSFAEHAISSRLTVPHEAAVFTRGASYADLIQLSLSVRESSRPVVAFFQAGSIAGALRQEFAGLGRAVRTARVRAIVRDVRSMAVVGNGANPDVVFVATELSATSVWRAFIFGFRNPRT